MAPHPDHQNINFEAQSPIVDSKKERGSDADDRHRSAERKGKGAEARGDEEDLHLLST